MKEDNRTDLPYQIMTNEEYREELRILFENIHENYKLRWFYRFIVEKIKDS